MTIIMPIEIRYLFPVWFLMLLSGSTALASFIGDHNNQENMSKINRAGGICFALGSGPLIVIWAAAICLLLAFPFRYKRRNIDKYFNAHPDNIFLLKNQTRSNYPDIWDFEARLELLDKLNKKIPQDGYRWMRSWMKFYLSRKNSSGQKSRLISENYPYFFQKIHWQELLLKSFSYFGTGDKKKGEESLKTALISCVISEAYVRTEKKYTLEEKKYAEQIAMTMVPFCSGEYGKFFFSVPPWDKKLRKSLRDSSFAVSMLSETKYLDFYRGKTEDKCSECCMPDKKLSFPSRCGNDSGKLHSSARADLIPVYLESSYVPLCFSKITKNNADFIQRTCLQYYHLGDEDDVKLAKISPAFANTYYMRHRGYAITNALVLLMNKQVPK
ncbi:MAG: hypothetical protein K5838_01050 [Elusimicrobiales bacterium]|nr:hypothetical protein [Elusimicrobiales bacterium]